MSARLAAAPAATPSSAARGVGCILASALLFSTAGLFTGLVAADPWTILVWRGVCGGLFLAGCVAWQGGLRALHPWRWLSRPALAAAGCSTLGTLLYIHALRLSSVAEVTLLFATAPFLAAAFAWAWHGEKPARATLLASLLALAGVALMTGAAPGSGHLLGNLLALGMTALIAAMMVIIRRHRALPMLPAACLSAFASALLALPLARPFAVTGAEAGWLALFGAGQFGLGLLLLTQGSRLLPGARAALLGNAELPLAPLWVWLAFGSLPPAGAWAGGLVVVLALAIDLLAARQAAAPR
ncbi:EamA family transporter [Siccirubricoccus phaeus]|uniref:EamA family transporter n=1 Tax=Siccirubricoccus phaeus TaxID=2595053 RepID=UPI0011F2066D|nr:EamA family transporter [Siccirubricoccus phaeus]